MYGMIYTLIQRGIIPWEGMTIFFYALGGVLCLQAILLLAMFFTKWQRRKRHLSVFVALVWVILYAIPYIYTWATT